MDRQKKIYIQLDVLLNTYGSFLKTLQQLSSSLLIFNNKLFCLYCRTKTCLKLSEAEFKEF